MDYFQHVDSYLAKGVISAKIADLLKSFYVSYRQAIADKGESFDDHEEKFRLYCDFAARQAAEPYPFELYHKMLREPFDYFEFGLSFVGPLIVKERSRVEGLEHVDRIAEQIGKGENVILFANHQIEPDPQAIAVMLRDTHPRLAEEMIFVAGHRVTTDPLAVPLSLGCNMLCIYSKKHVENPPELKEQKMLHNKRTMLRMAELLAEGGKCIYVAPSGGRDRPDERGFVDVAPFDPQSIEMFRLMALQSGKATHFYPLALSTYKLLPPPDRVEKELGESRRAGCSPAYLCFNKELDWDAFPGDATLDKKELRQKRADHIWSIVKNDYQRIITDL